MPTLQQYAIDWANPNAIPIINGLLKQSGIMATAEFNEAEQGLLDKYTVVTGLPTASIRAINGSTAPTKSKEKQEQVDLKLIQADQEYDKVLVENSPGGKDVYFAKKLPAFIQAMGQAFSKYAIYGNNATFGSGDGFRGFHQFAKAFGNVTQLSGTTGSRTSLIAVTYQPEAVDFLLPFGGNFADFLKSEWMNNGMWYKAITSTTLNESKPVYGMMHTIITALRAAHKYSIAAITQIDDTHQPTAMQVDDMLDKVRATKGSTFIYASRKGKKGLKNLRYGKQVVDNADMNFMFDIKEWNDITVVVDDNIRDDETTVLD